MYEYVHVPCHLGGVFREPNHREIIKKYAENGYRLIQVLPLYNEDFFECEIIFEKYIEKKEV